MGITIELTRRFIHKNYMVMKMKIVAIDKDLLILKTKGEEFYATFTTLVKCLERMEVENALVTVNERVETKVFEGLKSRLAEIIPEKLSDQGVQVKMIICEAKEQADFFHDFMESSF